MRTYFLERCAGGPCISKLFERAMSDQMSEYFSNIFHSTLAAFRPGCGCQSTLMSPSWPADQGLEIYGMNCGVVDLVSSFLSGRTQQVRPGSKYGDWFEVLKGVPRGYIMGSLLFNNFINDTTTLLITLLVTLTKTLIFKNKFRKRLCTLDGLV